MRKLERDTKKIRKVMEQAGHTIGSVHFRKKSNQKLRKMSYRLHVKNPSIAESPTGMGWKDGQGTKSRKKKEKAADVMTVLDVNKVVRDAEGNIIGRGAWRMVPLKNVDRIKVRGKEYKVS